MQIIGVAWFSIVRPLIMVTKSKKESRTPSNRGSRFLGKSFSRLDFVPALMRTKSNRGETVNFSRLVGSSKKAVPSDSINGAPAAPLATMTPFARHSRRGYPTTHKKITTAAVVGTKAPHSSMSINTQVSQQASSMKSSMMLTNVVAVTAAAAITAISSSASMLWARSNGSDREP